MTVAHRVGRPLQRLPWYDRENGALGTVEIDRFSIRPHFGAETAAPHFRRQQQEASRGGASLTRLIPPETRGAFAVQPSRWVFSGLAASAAAQVKELREKIGKLETLVEKMNKAGWPMTKISVTGPSSG
jgi:hypothetical protein